jgi:hypothetical protein
VTQPTQKGRPLENNQIVTGRRYPVRSLGAIAFLVLASAVGGYLYGLHLIYDELASAQKTIQDLRPESQRLKSSILVQNGQITDLERELAGARAALQAIMPSENTYIINPNQSVVVAAGKLIVGVVGRPSNDSVKVNINGNVQTMTTGDVVRVAVDPSTSCEVGVQFFDMFKITVRASCATLKQNQ